MVFANINLSFVPSGKWRTIRKSISTTRLTAWKLVAQLEDQLTDGSLKLPSVVDTQRIRSLEARLPFNRPCYSEKSNSKSLAVIEINLEISLLTTVNGFAGFRSLKSPQRHSGKKPCIIRIRLKQYRGSQLNIGCSCLNFVY